MWGLNGSYLKVVHAVRQRHHKPGVIVDGLVAENDIYAVVEIPEIVLGCRQLTAVILWVIPEHMKERWMKDKPLQSSLTAPLDGSEGNRCNMT